MSAFDVNFDGFKALEVKMMRLPGKMEQTFNRVFHTDGINIATEEITKDIPISRSKWGIRNKTHARNSNWSQSEKLNLGFKIKSRGGAASKKGSFGYLIFPNDGIGSHNPVERRFMESGARKAKPKILVKLQNGVDKVLEEEF